MNAARTLVLSSLAWLTATAAEPGYPEFDGAVMQQGRKVWIGTCATCHTDDFTGAPLIDNRKAWESRIAQGKEVLYAHAIDGFFGPLGTEMPARGDNPQLSDAEVKAAVDYMLALIESINK